MARVSLQIKSVASLVLATGASVAWSMASRRFFDTPPKPALGFAIAGVVLLACQLGLIFVESKEEEELSLVRRQRMAGLQQAIAETQKLSARIQQEIESGNLESAEQWTVYREKHHGE